jgi:hypothetical protein
LGSLLLAPPAQALRPYPLGFLQARLDRGKVNRRYDVDHAIDAKSRMPLKQLLLPSEAVGEDGGYAWNTAAASSLQLRQEGSPLPDKRDLPRPVLRIGGAFYHRESFILA